MWKPIIQAHMKKTTPIAVKSFIYQWVKNTARNRRVSFATLASRIKKDNEEIMASLAQEQTMGPPDFNPNHARVPTER